MPAAVPSYVKDFADAPPGHRFGLYYAGWDNNWRKPKNGVVDILDQLAKLPAHSIKLLAALNARQQAAASAAGDAVLAFPCLSSSPFATGLGNEHPLENGFSFLTPYGLPYLPGSGVKGVIRKAAEELSSGDWGEEPRQGWNDDTIRTLFGPGEEDPSRDNEPLQGALRFWDVIPTPPVAIKNDKALLTVEIMTPHHSSYYQDGKTPNTSESPNPISFLAVAPESRFTFHVECNPARLSPELRDHWRPLIEAAFNHAGKWLGFGAKTAVGYGRMRLDPGVAAQREAARAEQAQNKAREAEQARIAMLPADRRLLADLDGRLAELPKDPRDGKPIVQPTSASEWHNLLGELENATPSITCLDKTTRESLASEVKKRLGAHFKVEGKADKALKGLLSTLRGS